MSSYIYILTNKKHGTLYTGVTADLVKRIYQHKNNLTKGFSKKYNTHQLVYYEMFDDIYNAITREKQIKSWRRQWKIDIIETMNPNWHDLYFDIIA